jgi:hypothetical protein
LTIDKVRALRVFRVFYAIASIFLALSLWWVKAYIVDSPDVTDSYGSGADPFIWFAYVSRAFLVFVALQCLFFFVERSLTKGERLGVILASFSLWIVVFTGLAITSRL